MPASRRCTSSKNFDEWFKSFYAIPHQKLVVGGFSAAANRNRVYVVAELASSEVKDVKDFIQSKHMQDVFKQVNDMSTAPMEFIWLEELSLTSMDKVIFAPLAIALGEW
jgi:hypothetical protein